jgi:transposase
MVRSEAAYAALAGVRPIPESSGDTVRHRLTRHGDRQLNQVVDRIAGRRIGFGPAARAFVERRTLESKTRREIRSYL